MHPIPEQLRRDDLRFIRIPPRSKGGQGNDLGWNTTAWYHWDSEQLEFHLLEEGFNYGVYPGPDSNVVIVDIDEPQIIENLGLFPALEGTFTVLTGSATQEKPKCHYYFESPNLLTGKSPLWYKDVHVGELYAQDPEKGRGYVVGPGSIHPDTKRRYSILRNLPIATRDLSEFLSHFKQAEGKPAPLRPKRDRITESLTDRLGLRIEDVCHPVNSHTVGDEIIGGHPLHGSQTGTNIHLNRMKNTWHCHRCGSGGDPAMWLAVESGTISCEDARAGALANKDVMKRLVEWMRGRGYNLPEPRKWEKHPRTERSTPRLDKQLCELPMTELGNSSRLVSRYGQDIRYCHTFKSWYIWNGQRWERDDTGQIVAVAKRMVRKIIDESDHIDDPDRRQTLFKHAIKSQKLASIKAAIILAEDEVSAKPEAFDADPALFNLQNGTFNLVTMAFREHQKDDMLTKMAGTVYDPGATCPVWEAHLKRIFGDAPEFISDFQMMCGYSMLGLNPEQIMFILHGSGKNGKSKTLNALREVFGEYAISVAPETLMARKFNEGGGARSDIARLFGVRFAVSIEGESNARFGEALIKQLTGGDTVTVRRLYEKEFEFTPVCKIWFSSNHLPVIRGTDLAIWRRIWMIPFQVQIPVAERDLYIEEKFRKEYPGILNWCIEGLRLYRQTGKMEQPKRVQNATETYRFESDTLAQFISDWCVLSEKETCTRVGLFHEYQHWCESNNERSVVQKVFSKMLREHGIMEGPKLHGVRHWRGIRIKTENERNASEIEENLARWKS